MAKTKTVATLNLKFKQEFEDDLWEAFDYWVEQRKLEAPTDEIKSKLESFTMSQWIASLLSKPVYELIRQKRVNDA